MHPSRRQFLWATGAAAVGGTALTYMGCKSGGGDPWNGTTKKRILTSIVPIHCFAAHIAEPDAEVRCLLTTTGPHHFIHGPQDAKLVSSADAFIVNGIQLESFLDPLIRSSGNQRLRVVRAGDAIPVPKPGRDGPGTLIATKAFKHGDHMHPAGHDPHVWLGIAEAQLMVDAIRAELARLDPGHADNYRQRAAAFNKELEALYRHGEGLKGLAIVTFHDSFRYFGRCFGVTIATTIRGQRGEDIAQAKLNEEMDKLRRDKVRIIGVEPQYSPAIAETLARDLDPEGRVRIVQLDPLETAPSLRDYYVDKSYYATKMKENIDRLLEAKQALG